MKYTTVPFVGGFYADETRAFSVQDCVNYLPEQAEAPGTRTAEKLKTPPGLRDFGIGYAVSISGDLANQILGAVISFQYTTTGLGSGLTLSISSGALPTGLSMDSSGLVTGTTSAAGSFSWQVRATDSFGRIATLNDSASVYNLATATPVASIFLSPVPFSIDGGAVGVSVFTEISPIYPTPTPPTVRFRARNTRQEADPTNPYIGTGSTGTFTPSKVIIYNADNSVYHDFGWAGDISQLSYTNAVLTANGYPLTTAFVSSPQYLAVDTPPAGLNGKGYRISTNAASGVSVAASLDTEYMNPASYPADCVALNIAGVVGYVRSASTGALYKAPWATP